MVKIDTLAPGAPNARLAVDSNLPADGVTNNGTIVVGGIEPGATWSYSTNNGSAWTQATAGAASFILGPGTYASGAVKVKQTDLAGNESTPLALSQQIVVDNTAPTSQPLFSPTSPASSNTNVLLLSGSVASLGTGEVVAIYDGAIRLGVAQLSNPSGITGIGGGNDFLAPGNSWTFNTPRLDNGAHAFTARV